MRGIGISVIPGNRHRWFGVGTALLVSSVFHFLVHGCDVPVFEYALKLWPADAYEATVLHSDQPLALETIAALKADKTANLVVRETRLIEPTADADNNHTAESSYADPVLTIRYPVREGTRQTIWSGKITPGIAAHWLESPVRQTLIRNLKSGSAGVWVLLESGNKQLDEAAFNLLNKELDYLQRVMLLPGPSDEDDQFADNDLNPVAPVFVRMRLSQNDPREEPLVNMLLGSEPDLASRRNEPMIFPIYGRGLILHAMVGAGINANTIAEAAGFLAGPCSCEVKSQNPGLEILLSTEWEEAPTIGFADFQEKAARAEAQLEDIRGIPLGGIDDGQSEHRNGRRKLGLGISVVGLAVLAAVITVLSRSKRHRGGRS